MALDPEKVFERSIDSIARIYAVVIGVALSESVRTLITKDSHGDRDLSSNIWIGMPAFVAFVITLAPFRRGTNRRLDRSYLEKKQGQAKQGGLLIDFMIFFLEAIPLFIAGSSLRHDLPTFYLLGAVLAIDMVWGGIAHQIHSPGEKSHLKRWAMINAGAGAGAILIVLFPFEHKPLALMLVALLRSGPDYAICWEFYFPKAANPIVAIGRSRPRQEPKPNEQR